MQTVEINTAQNVPIVYELAGLRDRLLAFLLDFVILCGAMFIIVIIGIFATTATLGSSTTIYVIYVVELLIFFFYTLSQELIFNGQTIGKMALKIKVVRLDGQEVTGTDFLTRWMFRMIDIYFSAGSVAAMLVSSTEKCQRLGDLLSGTTVIRLQPRLSMGLHDLMKIQTIENYTPKFPDARKLHEEDMIIVKNALDRYNRFPNSEHSFALSLAAKKIGELLNVEKLPANRIEFLKTVLRDYVVMTR